MSARAARRRWLVPEVVQTALTDCGPATLQCLLAGFGIPASYGRLREACQTDVDGTSISVLEAVAGRLGLDAEQVMIPVDHLLLREAEALPAIVVVVGANGLPHFVLAWRRHGPWLQVMDPAVGRRWVRGPEFLQQLYVHEHLVAAPDWRAWAGGDDFCRPLRRRLHDLGIGRAARRLQEQALADPSWAGLARLDAGARMAAALTRAGGLRRGREAGRLLTGVLERARQAPAGSPPVSLPWAFWSVRPQPGGPTENPPLVLRGAVLLRARGRRAPAAAEARDGSAGAEALSPELAAAVQTPEPRPWQAAARLLAGRGLLFWGSLALLVVVAAGCSVLEALLLRVVADAGWYQGAPRQRLRALGGVGLFFALHLLVRWRLAGQLWQLGRRLEVRLRAAFLHKVPRLYDRYFHSRPQSDMAERAHALAGLHELPYEAGQLATRSLTLLATVAAIAWFAPGSAVLAVLAGAVALGLPLFAYRLWRELHLRASTQAGALTTFYLDALLGLSAVRAHAAEGALAREHEGLLVELLRTQYRLLRWGVAIEGLSTLTGFGMASLILLTHVRQPGDVGGILLLAYWALSLPALGTDIATMSRLLPLYRNTILRSLEPLGAPAAPEAEDAAAAPRPAPGESAGVAVSWEAVTVVAAGHTILDGVTLHLGAGSHAAIVGASGAGKSSLVGLLLGWHRPASGRVRIDGDVLDAARLDRLRDETAWVDPAVHLWNRTLLENLQYGEEVARPLAPVLDAAELYEVLQRLPDGLQTTVGEGGGLLSGGQGQRVRLGRAFRRSEARLVVLDEPFRGLDRDQRQVLLRRARQLWSRATLLCVTHDVGQALEFPRVLVVDGGRVVEDGDPRQLAETPRSRFGALLAAERLVLEDLWKGGHWRRFRLEQGRLVSGVGEGNP
jgi:ATP-binding cassette subfamily B protein